MAGKRFPGLAALVALAVAGGVGYAMFALMELRFGMGDVYPACSSFATDRLGTRALYDTLAEFDTLNVRRNLAPLRALEAGQGDVVMLLGHEPNTIAGGRNGDPVFLDTQWAVIKSMAIGGARAVVAVRNEFGLTSSSTSSDSGTTTEAEAGASEAGLNWYIGPWEAPARGRRVGNPSVAQTDSDDVFGSCTLIGRAWLAAANAGSGDAAEGPKGWKVVARRGRRSSTGVGEIIAMERALGTGSVAVLAESYPFTNEALGHRESGGVVAWALGDAPRRIIFDETHLGLSEQPGIATLARRFGLAGLAPGLAVALGLWLWRVRSSLAPPASGTTDTGGVAVAGAGKDAATGLTNLLRRRVAPDALFEACVAEWERTLAPAADAATLARRDEARRAMRMELDSHPRERDAVAAYARVTAILNRRD